MRPLHSMQNLSQGAVSFRCRSLRTAHFWMMQPNLQTVRQFLSTPAAGFMPAPACENLNFQGRYAGPAAVNENVASSSSSRPIYAPTKTADRIIAGTAHSRFQPKYSGGELAFRAPKLEHARSSRSDVEANIRKESHRVPNNKHARAHLI